MSKHVEKQLQLHVEQLPGIQQLWRVAGAGGPKGLPPYTLLRRRSLHPARGADGSLPNGFYHTTPRSEMASAAVPTSPHPTKLYLRVGLTSVRVRGLCACD